MVRLKNRYIVIQIKETHRDETAPLTLRMKSLQESIQEKIQQFHGDFGAAAIRDGFQAKYCNEHTKIAIVRCRHGPHKLVRSTIPFITSVQDNTVNIHILYIGATIRQSFKFIKNYQEKKVDQFCSKLKTDKEKLALKSAILNFESILHSIS